VKITKANFEKAKDDFFSARNGFDSAKKALDAYRVCRGSQLGATMYHLSITVKFMLKILCVKYNVDADNDDFALLFAKTRRFLTKDILAVEILDMETELLCWHHYNSASIKTADEAAGVARIFENYFCEVIRKFMCETKKAIEWPEDGFDNSGIF